MTADLPVLDPQAWRSAHLDTAWGSDGTDASHVKPSELPGTSSAATTVEALGSDITTSWKLLPSLSRGIQQLNHIITVLRHWFPEDRPAHPQKRASH